MKTPKITRRTNDKMFQLEYKDLNSGKRIRKSLGTRDYNEAKIAFIEITGTLPQDRAAEAIPYPLVKAPPRDNQGHDYADAVSQFLLCKYGIEDGWDAKPKKGCALKSTSARSSLKMFRKYSNIFCVSEANYSNLQAFQNLKRGTASNQTVNRHMQRISRFLDYCVNMDWIIKNHAPKVERLKEDVPVRYSFSKEQVKMIWEKIHPRFKSFYQLMLETGLRGCDMWDLTKGHFPQGEDGMELQIQQGKTGKWLRVPITKRAEEIVNSLDDVLFPWSEKAWWIENNKWNQRTKCRNALWLCFGSDHTGPEGEFKYANAAGYERNGDWGRLERGKAICKPDNIRMHTLRHTFAMWHLAKGTPLEALKDLLGHMSIRMTEVYASQMPKKALLKYIR